MATVTGSDGLTYTLNGDTLTITGNGRCQSLKEGLVDTNALDARSAKYLIIGEGVNRLDYNFMLTALLSVQFPSTLTYIGSYTFYACTGLTNIILPSAVAQIDSEAFEGCNNMTSIVFKSSSKPTMG